MSIGLDGVKFNEPVTCRIVLRRSHAQTPSVLDLAGYYSRGVGRVD